MENLVLLLVVVAGYLLMFASSLLLASTIFGPKYSRSPQLPQTRWAKWVYLSAYVPAFSSGFSFVAIMLIISFGLSDDHSRLAHIDVFQGLISLSVPLLLFLLIIPPYQKHHWLKRLNIATISFLLLFYIFLIENLTVPLDAMWVLMLLLTLVLSAFYLMILFVGRVFRRRQKKKAPLSQGNEDDLQ